MNPFQTSRLLSETRPAGARFQLLRYGDEQNCKMVPAGWVEAGGEI